MKIVLRRPEETELTAESIVRAESQDVHDFESVGDILRRMFASARVDVPLSEERK